MRNMITVLVAALISLITIGYESAVLSVYSSDPSSEKSALMAEGGSSIVLNERDNKYYVSSRQRLWIESKDLPDGAAVGVHKIEVKIDNGEFHEYFGSKTGKFSLEKEGSHVIVFRATDKLGNVEQAKVFEVAVDNTPPWVEVEYQAKAPFKYCAKGNSIFVPVNHQIAARAFDVGSGVQKIEVSKNGEAYQEVKAGSPFQAPNPGWNVVRVKATDNVLNESSEYVLNVFVDNKAPIIQITPKYALIGENGEVLDDTGGGKAGSSDKAAAADTKPAATDPKATATDPKTAATDPKATAGKDSKPAAADTTSPADSDLPISEPIQANVQQRDFLPGQSGGGNRYAAVDNTYSISAYDKESGISLIEVKVDGSEWNIYRKPIQFFTQGKHTIEVRATDCVGNQSTSSVEVTVDNLAPVSKERTEGNASSGSGSTGSTGSTGTKTSSTSKKVEGADKGTTAGKTTSPSDSIINPQSEE